MARIVPANRLTAPVPAVSGTGVINADDIEHDPVFSVGTQVYRVGDAYALDMNAICTDADGDTLTFREAPVQETPPDGYIQGWPPGITWDPVTQRPVGTFTTEGNYSMTVEANDGNLTALAEWQDHSTLPGTFYANNFDFADRAALLATSYPNSATAFGNDFYSGRYKTELDTDPSRLLSSQANLRINLFASEGPQDRGGQYNFGFAGLGTLPKVQKRKFYMRFGIWCDSYYLEYDQFNNGAGAGSGASKLVLTYEPNASFGQSEILLQRSRFGRFPTMYIYNSRNGVVNTSNPLYLKWSPLGPNYHYHGFINTDTAAEAAPATTNALQLRHGMTYSGMSKTDPEANAVSPKFNPDGWTILELFVDMDQDIVKWWIANRGEAPQLFMGSMNAGFGGSSREFTGGQLMLRVENAIAPWISQDTFVLYSELICSDNPIPFPGGHALPYPDNQLPWTPWPPTGSTVV